MSNVERRHGYVDIEQLLAKITETVKEQSREMHKHDRAIAILETQIKAGEDRTNALEISIRAIYEKMEELSTSFSQKMDALANSLADHIRKEDKDRIKLLMTVIATLTTGLASLVFEILRRS